MFFVGIRSGASRALAVLRWVAILDVDLHLSGGLFARHSHARDHSHRWCPPMFARGPLKK